MLNPRPPLFGYATYNIYYNNVRFELSTYLYYHNGLTHEMSHTEKRQKSPQKRPGPGYATMRGNSLNDEMVWWGRAEPMSWMRSGRRSHTVVMPSLAAPDTSL